MTTDEIKDERDQQLLAEVARLRAALQLERDRATYTDREGRTWCRDRHGRDHGWHGPGSCAGYKPSGESTVLGCVRCKDYRRISAALDDGDRDPQQVELVVLDLAFWLPELRRLRFVPGLDDMGRVCAIGIYAELRTPLSPGETL